MMITKITSRPMCNKGTIARKMEFKTTWRPEKRKKDKMVEVHIGNENTKEMKQNLISSNIY